MTTNNHLLIPGAWSDESIWDGLSIELLKLGCRVKKLTLSGLGGDEYREISLSDHVNDVVRIIASNEAEKVTLVSHSYSGIVASLAATKIPDQIDRLIYIEAFLPEEGKSLLEIADLDVRSEEQSIIDNDGLWIPPTINELKHQALLTDEQINYLSANLKGHPGRTVTDRIRLQGSTLSKIPMTFIGNNLSDRIISNGIYDTITFHQLNGGHWPMITRPAELALLITKTT